MASVLHLHLPRRELHQTVSEAMNHPGAYRYETQQGNERLTQGSPVLFVSHGVRLVPEEEDADDAQDVHEQRQQDDHVHQPVENDAEQGAHQDLDQRSFHVTETRSSAATLRATSDVPSWFKFGEHDLPWRMEMLCPPPLKPCQITEAVQHLLASLPCKPQKCDPFTGHRTTRALLNTKHSGFDKRTERSNLETPDEADHSQGAKRSQRAQRLHSHHSSTSGVSASLQPHLVAKTKSTP